MTTFRSIAAALLVAAAAAAPAAAADMPTKAAPAAAVLSGYTGQGFYYGLNFGGDAGTVDATVAPSGVAGTFTQAGGQAGFTVGYAWGLGGGAFAAIEADFDAMGQMANGLGGLSLKGPAAFDQRLIYGGGIFDTFLTTISGLVNLGAIPPFQGPIPAGATATNHKMYGFAGISERDVSADFALASNKAWSISPEAGIGLRTQYTKGFATDVKTGVLFEDKSICVLPGGSAACANVGPKGFVRFSLLY